MQPAIRFVVLGLFALAISNSAFAAKLVLVARNGDKITASPPLEKMLFGPFGVDFDQKGNMFLIEMLGNRLWVFGKNGYVSTVAGTTGEKGYRGDGGPAATALLNGPHSLAVLPNSDVLIADTWNNRVRRVDYKARMISTFAGTGEQG